MPASTTMLSANGSHGRRVSARSSANVAGLANTATAMKVSPHSPKIEAPCASVSGPVSA